MLIFEVGGGGEEGGAPFVMNVSIKEIIKCATLGIPKGMNKCSFYFYCNILIRNKNIISKEHKTKNRLK